MSVVSNQVVQDLHFDINGPGISSVVGAGGRPFKIIGKVGLTLELCGKKDDMESFVIDHLPSAYEVILGQDVLSAFDIVVECGTLSVIKAKNIRQKVTCPYSINLPAKHEMHLTVKVPDITIPIFSCCFFTGF